MEAERHKALMDALDILIRAIDEAIGRDALLLLTHAIDHVSADAALEYHRAEEVSA